MTISSLMKHYKRLFFGKQGMVVPISAILTVSGIFSAAASLLIAQNGGNQPVYNNNYFDQQQNSQQQNSQQQRQQTQQTQNQNHGYVAAPAQQP